VGGKRDLYQNGVLYQEVW